MLCQEAEIIRSLLAAGLLHALAASPLLPALLQGAGCPSPLLSPLSTAVTTLLWQGQNCPENQAVLPVVKGLVQESSDLNQAIPQQGPALGSVPLCLFPSLALSRCGTPKFFYVSSGACVQLNSGKTGSCARQGGLEDAMTGSVNGHFFPIRTRARAGTRQGCVAWVKTPLPLTERPFILPLILP